MSSDGKPNPAAAQAKRGRSTNRRVYVIGCLCIVITLLAAGFAIRELYRGRIAEEMQSTRNLAIVLAEQTARSIQAVDLIIQDTRGMALLAGAIDPDQFRQRMATPEVHRYLVDRLRSLPQASSIALLDDRGTIVNFSRTWPIPVIHAAERDFFQYFRDHNDPGAFIGGPMLDKYDGGLGDRDRAPRQRAAGRVSRCHLRRYRGAVFRGFLSVDSDL